ncbi:vitamin K epoxide reductase family protein, partial [Candidatus Daviesbacteria bacterium]|nr:vitamin K epoxide reductase family protein [Candidatus Daviesbacteria bacterium]
MKKKLVVSLIILSFLGLLDAAYLTITHYQNTAPFCNIEHPCSIVLTSKFATLGTIPIALLGSFYYLLVIGFGIFFLKTKRKTILLQLFGLTLIGFLVSIGLFLIQALILKAFCIYCIFSELVSLGLFILSFLVL